MTNARVTVCVTVPDGQPVAEAVAAALAPFDMADDPENGRWDGWSINAGDRTLPVLADRAADPRIVRMSDPPPDRCDGAPRGLLDFTADRAAARARAETDWAQWHRVAAAHPAGRSLRELMRHHPVVEARRLHMAQPVIQAYLAEHHLDPDRFLFQDFSDPIGHYGDDPAAYVRHRVARVAPTEELLRLDGVWTDDADFGDQADESRWDRYYPAADAYIDALPPDVYIIRVRIHS